MTSFPIGEWSCPRTKSCWPQARLLSRSPILTCALRACTIGDTAGALPGAHLLIHTSCFVFASQTRSDALERLL